MWWNVGDLNRRPILILSGLHKDLYFIKNLPKKYIHVLVQSKFKISFLLNLITKKKHTVRYFLFVLSFCTKYWTKNITFIHRHDICILRFPTEILSLPPDWRLCHRWIFWGVCRGSLSPFVLLPYPEDFLSLPYSL